MSSAVLSSAEGKGLNRRPFPWPPSRLDGGPASAALRKNTILLPFRSVSVTIRKPASLRSDLADRLPENGDRLQRRMSDRFRENPHEMITALHGNGVRVIIIEKLDRLAREPMHSEQSSLAWIHNGVCLGNDDPLQTAASHSCLIWSSGPTSFSSFRNRTRSMPAKSFTGYASASTSSCACLV